MMTNRASGAEESRALGLEAEKQTADMVQRPENPGREAAHSGALVIGGDYRGLGVVRSLGRHGIPVWVLSDSHRLAAFSRFATRSFPFPEDEPRQLELLLALHERYALDGWLIFPTGDETAGMVSRHCELLEPRFRLTVPPWDVLQFAYDKRLTHRLAAETGVDYPGTVYPKSRADVEQLGCTFPAIIKPAIKEGFNELTHSKAWLVRDRKELVTRYEQAAALVSPDIIMVQELVPGGGETQYSYAALCDRGYPVVSLVALRMRQYPIDFGRSSSYVETVEQPEVEQAALCLLKTLEYSGLVEVEFKRDPRDGKFKLLDINPRVWGWHTLGRRFGGDFPYLLWRLVHNEPIPEARIRAGIRWIRGVTDIPAATQEVARGRLSLFGYLRSFRRPLEPAIFAADDPLPWLVEVPLLSSLALKRGAA